MSTLPTSGLPELASSREIADALGLKLPTFNQSMRKYGPSPSAMRGSQRVWDRFAQVEVLKAVIKAACYPSRWNDQAIDRAERLLPLLGKDHLRELRRKDYQDEFTRLGEDEVLGDLAARHGRELDELRAKHTAELLEGRETYGDEIKAAARTFYEGQKSMARSWTQYRPIDRSQLRNELTACSEWDEAHGEAVERALAALESGDEAAIAAAFPERERSSEERLESERRSYAAHVRMTGRAFDWEPGHYQEALTRDSAAMKKEGRGRMARRGRGKGEA